MTSIEPFLCYLSARLFDLCRNPFANSISGKVFFFKCIWNSSFFWDVYQHCQFPVISVMTGFCLNLLPVFQLIVWDLFSAACFLHPFVYLPVSVTRHFLFHCSLTRLSQTDDLQLCFTSFLPHSLLQFLEGVTPPLSICELWVMCQELNTGQVSWVSFWTVTFTNSLRRERERMEWNL